MAGPQTSMATPPASMAGPQTSMATPPASMVGPQAARTGSRRIVLILAVALTASVVGIILLLAN
jgi:hypothetical protein